MKKSQQATLGRFKRIQDFLDLHAAELIDVNRSHARVLFDEAITELDGCAAAQATASVRARSHTALRTELREDLIVSHLHPIVTIVRACLSHLPVLGSLQMPRKCASDWDLLLDARRTSDAIGANRYVFLAEGLPDDFVEQLIETADELSELLKARDQSRFEAIASTERIRRSIAEGLERLRLLNALVLLRIRGNEELAAGW